LWLLLWVSANQGLGSFASSATAWASDVRVSINSTVDSLRSIGSSINLNNLGAFAMAMAADPHMALAMFSMVPGLGEIAAAADMAIYLYQGDFQNASLAATMFLPGGALIALGGAAAVGMRAARSVDEGMSLMARAGTFVRDAVADSKIMSGLTRAGRDIKAVISAVGTKVRSFVHGGEKAVEDIGVAGEKADSVKLAKNLEADGTTRAAGFQAHHIVPGGDSRSALSQALLEKWRVGINSAKNGVFLPGSKAIARNPLLNPAGVIHHGATFGDAYHLRVYELLKTARSQDDVLDRLDFIRSSLQAGRLP
jgi:hypothetical protein